MDDKYAGFFDPPLLHDYSSIAVNYMRMGLTDEAYAYVGRIKTVLERHINGPWEGNQSKLLYATTLPNTVPPEQSCKKLLQDMLNAPEFEPFKQELTALQARYEAHFATKRTADE